MKANVAARQAGLTKKRYKGLDQPPKYVSPTLTYQLGHDYSFKTEQRVSLLTLDGRVIVSYSGYDRHVALIRAGAQIGAAKLWYGDMLPSPEGRDFSRPAGKRDRASAPPATGTA